MCRVWLSVEDREFLLPKFVLLDSTTLRESVQDSRATWRPGALMLELDRPATSTCPPNNAVPRWPAPHADIGSFNRPTPYGGRRGGLVWQHLLPRSYRGSRGRSPGPINRLAKDRHIFWIASPDESREFTGLSRRIGYFLQ